MPLNHPAGAVPGNDRKRGVLFRKRRLNPQAFGILRHQVIQAPVQAIQMPGRL